MEVGWDWQPVVEVVGIDQLTGAADVEHDRQAGFAGRCPHGIQGDVARRVCRRAARGDEQCGRAHRDRLGGKRSGAIEIGQGHVQAGQQPGICRAEVDHCPVVGPRRTNRQVEVTGVFPRAQPGVVEGVEDQLAGEAEQIEGPAAVRCDECSRRGEVLAGHDLCCFRGEVVGRSMPSGESVEGGIEVA